MVFAGKRVLVILNPTSGKAKPDATASDVAVALEAAGARAVVRSTSDGEQPTRWAAEAGADGFGVVLAAGGDGTVRAVASGILRSGADVTMGIVPMGTGNGLARVLRIPIDVTRSIEAMAKGRVVLLDVVDVHVPRSLALFFLGAGLDAEINRDADSASKARFGFLAYLGATARNLRGRRNHRVRVVLDGRHEAFAAHTVTAFNAGQFEFAGLEVGPDVDPHDGYLDLTVMRAPGFWRSLGTVLRLASGHTDAATSRRVRRFRIDAEPPLLVHVDGDVVGSTPLEGEVVPAALRVIAAQDYANGGPAAAGPVFRSPEARGGRPEPSGRA